MLNPKSTFLVNNLLHQRWRIITLCTHCWMWLWSRLLERLILDRSASSLDSLIWARLLRLKDPDYKLVQVSEHQLSTTLQGWQLSLTTSTSSSQTKLVLRESKRSWILSISLISRVVYCSNFSSSLLLLSMATRKPILLRMSILLRILWTSALKLTMARRWVSLNTSWRLTIWK